MAIYNITNGLQAFSATGVISGTLSVATLTGNYTVEMRVQNLGMGNFCALVLQSSANGTFSDAQDIWREEYSGFNNPEGARRSRQWYQLQSASYGTVNATWRINCEVLTPGASPSVWAYLTQ